MKNSKYDLSKWKLLNDDIDVIDARSSKSNLIDNDCMVKVSSEYTVSSAMNEIISILRKVILPEKLDEKEWYDFDLRFMIYDGMGGQHGGATIQKSITSKFEQRKTIDELKLCQDYYKKNYAGKHFHFTAEIERSEPKVTYYPSKQTYQPEQIS